MILFLQWEENWKKKKSNQCLVFSLNKIMSLEINYKKACEFVFPLLENTDSLLCYHNIRHTRDDVLPGVENLAKLENINGNDFYLLLTAALFHDVGYLKTNFEHEAEGINLAEEKLPEFGFLKNQIEIVSGIIMATKMPQNPKNILEQIMCDADLGSLGRKDCFILGLKVREELNNFNKNISLKTWFEIQLKLLETHSYFTKSARKLLDNGKLENIKELKNLLEG